MEGKDPYFEEITARELAEQEQKNSVAEPLAKLYEFLLQKQVELAEVKSEKLKEKLNAIIQNALEQMDKIIENAIEEDRRHKEEGKEE